MEIGEHAQKKTWKIKKFPAHHRRTRRFNLDIDVGSKHGRYDDGVETIILKAVNRRGKRIGTKRYELKRNPNSPRGHIAIHPSKPNEVTCQPRPDFEVGVQDDDQFVFQEKISRDRAFDLATQTLGATTLRINVIYGFVKAEGFQPYIDTVNEAVRRGYKVHLTIMGTPSYYPQMDQDLGFQNMNPAEAKQFSTQIAQTFGNKVARYSIWNEPNQPYFSASTSINDYDRVYDAAEEGIHSVLPNAEVVAGELAPGNMDAWISNLNQLPDLGGISIHPYGDEINHVEEYVNESRVPLYLSEYGNPASDPLQAEHNHEAIAKARCAGAKLLLLYQLIRDPSRSWNTGILPADTK